MRDVGGGRCASGMEGNVGMGMQGESGNGNGIVWGRDWIQEWRWNMKWG